MNWYKKSKIKYIYCNFRFKERAKIYTYNKAENKMQDIVIDHKIRDWVFFPIVIVMIMVDQLLDFHYKMGLVES